jgi:multiple sugar transport system permease protein
MATVTQSPIRVGTQTKTTSRSSVTVGQIFQLLAMILLLLIILFPLFWMISTSLKTQNDTFAIPPKVLTFTPTLEHYQLVIGEGNVPRAGTNSLIIATATTLLAVILGTPAAYVLARFEFRGKRDVWFWFISNRFISPIVVVLPLYLMARDLGAVFKDAGINLTVLNTQWFLVLVYQTFSVPLVVWLCIDQFRAIPKDVDDAAKVDGYSLLQTFFYINLPLALPGIVVSAILSFIFAWNEMLFALLLGGNPARTAPVEASTFMTGMGIRWGDMMATGTLIVLPVIIFAALVSRHLVRGLTMGAVK